MKPKVFAIVFILALLTSCSFKGRIVSKAGYFSENLLKKYATFYDVDTGNIKISYKNIEFLLVDLSVIMDVLISNLNSYYVYDENNMPAKHSIVMFDENNSMKFEDWEDYKYTWNPESPMAQKEGPYTGYVISSGYSYKYEIQKLGTCLAFYENFAEILKQNNKTFISNTEYYNKWFDYFLQTLKFEMLIE